MIWPTHFRCRRRSVSDRSGMRAEPDWQSVERRALARHCPTRSPETDPIPPLALVRHQRLLRNAKPASHHELLNQDMKINSMGQDVDCDIRYRSFPPCWSAGSRQKQPHVIHYLFQEKHVRYYGRTSMCAGENGWKICSTVGDAPVTTSHSVRETIIGLWRCQFQEHRVCGKAAPRPSRQYK